MGKGSQRQRKQEPRIRLLLTLRLSSTVMYPSESSAPESVDSMSLVLGRGPVPLKMRSAGEGKRTSREEISLLSLIPLGIAHDRNREDEPHRESKIHP